MVPGMAWLSWRSRLRRLPAPVVDAGLAVALAVAITVAISVLPSQGEPPDALAYGLGLLIAALSLARRRWPLAVLLASAATLLFYNQFDYPGLFSAVPLSVALATAWAAGRRGWALAIAIWFGSTPLIFLALADLPTDTTDQLLNSAISDLTLLAAVLLLGEAVRGRRALDRAHRLLLAERERSEQLLLNVLPAPIAARLKQGEEVIADGFPEVTVLFADLVDFTRRSQETTPERVVRILDDLFSALDELAERHGLEKIKTIGDAYMAVGGLPEPRPDHAEAVAEMALAVREEVARHLDAASRPLAVRIGIDTGPVVAGGDRPAQVQLRPVGRHRQHRQPDGVERGGRLHPGDRPGLPAAARPLPVRAAGTGPGQGQGRAGHLVPAGPGGQPR
jgi:class 3 adenylate cyclase